MMVIAFDGARVASRSGFVLSMSGDHRAETVVFRAPTGFEDGAALGFVKLGAQGQPLVKKLLTWAAADGGYRWDVERAELKAVQGVTGLRAQFSLERAAGDGDAVVWESRTFPVTVPESIDADDVIEAGQPGYLLELDLRVQEAAGRAEAAADALSNPAVRLTMLPSDAPGSATVSREDGVVTYDFALPAGLTGAAGPKGDKGDAGQAGPQGPKGDKGDKGDPGSLDPSATLDMSQVEGLAAALAGKSPAGHGHAMGDVSGLAAALSGKSDAAHVHAEYLTAGSIAGKVDASGGAMTGALVAGGAQAVQTAQVRNITAGTADLTAGSSALATGAIYLVYE